MKIALLISGYLRGFIENVQSIQENIIQSHDCDIYMHISKDETTDKYFNKTVSYDTIIKLLNPKVLIISKNLNLSSNKTVNNLLNQNYKKYWLNCEMKKMASIENKVYDIVVYIRPDVNIKTMFKYEVNCNKIQIPMDSKIDINKLKNDDDMHICDIIAFGNQSVMEKYLNYYLKINELIEVHNTLVNETLLYHYLNNNNIEYELICIEYIVILSLCNTVAITGDSGSGKTTISKIINNLFANSFVLECDRYHKWERNDDNWKSYTHLNPDANYITKMCNDVFDLKLGKKVYQIDYDHTSGKFTDKNTIDPCENIIVCGLHCLYMPEHVINLKIYMDTDDNLRFPWKIERDVVKRGYSIDKIYKQIKERENDFYKYIYPQKEKADIIIRFYTNLIFDFDQYISHKKYPVFLKIGIKSCYNLNCIYNFNEINDIENLDNYIYINFKFFDNYSDILIKTLKELIINN